MKNLITVICLLCFAGCAYAEVYEVPGSQVVTEEEVQVQEDNNAKDKSETKVERKKILRHRDLNPTNTYWNFGKVPFWTGTI